MKKILLAKFLSLLGIIPIIIRLRRLFKQDILILAYHRIMDVDDHIAYAFDKELISASCKDFEWQLNYLKAHYDVIDFSELSKRFSERGKLSGKELLITFDDGFSDNYSNAFPLLRKVGLPGVFFISTDYIGKKHTYWFNEIVHAINTAKELVFKLGDIHHTFETNEANREKSCRLVLDYLKKVPNTVRLNTLKTLKGELDYNSKRTPDCELPMNWDNAIEMASNNMEFGSHSAMHPILSKLEETELRQEILGSKVKIETTLNRPCTTIAYPVGGNDAFSQNIETLVQREGYDFGCSYLKGTNDPNNLDTYALKRLHVERNIKAAEFKFMLCFPESYARGNATLN